MDSINWYPGHMAKTLRQLRGDLRVIDVVIELLDARIASSSKNPDIDALAADKRRIIVLNKADLADPAVTAGWQRFYESAGFSVIQLNSLGGGSAKVVARARALCADKASRLAGRGRVGMFIRAMIVGIPNVGKSTLINRLAKRTAAKAADIAGVTRGKQWIRVGEDVELLDTPGLLWPRMNENGASVNLALTGAVNDNIMDTETLAAELVKALSVRAPNALAARYGIPGGEAPTPHEALEQIAKSRRYLKRGGAADTGRAAAALLDEFRAGKLGRISLETIKN